MREERLTQRLSAQEMESVTRGQIPDDAVCVSLHAHAFEKGSNSSVFFFLATSLEERKL